MKPQRPCNFFKLRTVLNDLGLRLLPRWWQNRVFLTQEQGVLARALILRLRPSPELDLDFLEDLWTQTWPMQVTLGDDGSWVVSIAVFFLRMNIGLERDIAPLLFLPTLLLRNLINGGGNLSILLGLDMVFAETSIIIIPLSLHFLGFLACCVVGWGEIGKILTKMVLVYMIETKRERKMEVRTSELRWHRCKSERERERRGLRIRERVVGERDGAAVCTKCEN